MENRGLDGVKSFRKERGDEILVFVFSDIICFNEQLLFFRSLIESGFIIMSGFFIKVIKDCFFIIVDKIESNLLDLDFKISESEELT